MLRYQQWPAQAAHLTLRATRCVRRYNIGTEISVTGSCGVQAPPGTEVTLTLSAPDASIAVNGGQLVARRVRLTRTASGSAAEVAARVGGLVRVVAQDHARLLVSDSVLDHGQAGLGGAMCVAYWWFVAVDNAHAPADVWLPSLPLTAGPTHADTLLGL